eukprot:721626-Pleurochrysis_carterae.AAC.1
MNSRSLTVAAEYAARFASFKGAVVVEFVGENSIGLADESVFGAFDEVKDVVCYFALELLDLSCALLRRGGRGCPCSS